MCPDYEAYGLKKHGLTRSDVHYSGLGYSVCIIRLTSTLYSCNDLALGRYNYSSICDYMPSAHINPHKSELFWGTAIKLFMSH